MLAKACTKKAQCPPDYAEVAPYLDSFCDATTSDESLGHLARAVKQKIISRRSLGMIFNAYGAAYGYTFKSERWLDAFFYSTPAPWLPAQCRKLVKSKPDMQSLPLRMTLLRDKVKAIWDAAK